LGATKRKSVGGQGKPFSTPATRLYRKKKNKENTKMGRKDLGRGGKEKKTGN